MSGSAAAPGPRPSRRRRVALIAFVAVVVAALAAVAIVQASPRSELRSALLRAELEGLDGVHAAELFRESGSAAVELDAELDADVAATAASSAWASVDEHGWILDTGPRARFAVRIPAAGEVERGGLVSWAERPPASGDEVEREVGLWHELAQVAPAQRIELVLAIRTSEGDALEVGVATGEAGATEASLQERYGASLAGRQESFAWFAVLD